MEKKNHVGRPTNEEVANRKNKKVVKYSLIIIVTFLIVGCIALFFNRDNIDFSSLMGNTASKTYKYRVNYYFKNEAAYRIYIEPVVRTGKYTSCKVNKSKYAKCYIEDEHLIVVAKKKGNVKITLNGKDISSNKKNGKKTFSKTIKVKIARDFYEPWCGITYISKKQVKKNEVFYITIKCDEDVTLSKNVIAYKDYFFARYSYNFSSSFKKYVGNCPANDNYGYVKMVEKVNDKTYNVYYLIPEDACYSGKIKGSMERMFQVGFKYYTFQDSSGNLNVWTNNYDFITVEIIK